MSFPIKELIEYEGNIYELTCVASKRAYQLAKLIKNSHEGSEAQDKEVSIAAQQVFTKEITFSRDEKVK